MRARGLIFTGAIALMAATAAHAQTVKPFATPVKAQVVTQAKAAPATPVAPASVTSAAGAKLPPGPCASVEPLIAAANLTASTGGTNDTAMLDLDRAIDRAPACATAWLRRAELDLGQLDYDKTLSDARAAVARAPHNAEAYGMLGLAEAAQSENGADGDEAARLKAAAVADLTRAIGGGVVDPVILTARGTMYQELNDHDRAFADYDRAVALDPQDIQLLIGRGMAHETAGDDDLALADFAEARRHEGTDVMHDVDIRRTYVEAVRIYQRKGNFDAAIALLTQAIASHPKDGDYYRMRAEVYLRRHDEAHAIADLTSAIPLSRYPQEEYIRRAKIYSDRGDFAAALADAGAAIEADPGEASSYVARGDIEEARGDVTAAIADYDRGAALKNSVTSLQANNAACWVRAKHNIELDKAMAYCDAAMMRGTGYSDTLDSRGLVHFRRGEYAAAVADYTSALARNPKLATSLFGRALAEQKLGQAEAAKTDLAAARAADANIDDQFKGYGLVAE